LSTPTIVVQQLGAFNDPVEAAGGPVFLVDLDAVTQIIGQEIQLLLGEWWEDLSQGFPLKQTILGAPNAASNQAASLLLIQQAILACPYVTQILSFTYTGNSALRSLKFVCTVMTAFGTLTLTNAPAASAAVSS
jgi:hypothetical protein